jgi:hypothetical protein
LTLCNKSTTGTTPRVRTARQGTPLNTPCKCLGFVRKRRCCPCSDCPVWIAHAHCSAPPKGYRGQAHFLAVDEAAGGRLASVGGVRLQPLEFEGPHCPGCPDLFRDQSHLPSGQPPPRLKDQSLSLLCCPETAGWTLASKDRKFRRWVHCSSPDRVTLLGPAADWLPTSYLHRAWPMP